jgi:transcriptional regulator with XRE-family HTH domain
VFRNCAGHTKSTRFITTPPKEAIIARLVESLRDERLRQDLSLNAVAEKAGLSHATIMRVEKRQRLPTIDTLLRISDALEIDLSAFLRRASLEIRPRGSLKGKVQSHSG